MKKLLLYGLAASVAGCAAAPEPARPNPSDPKAAAPATTYRSAFEGYTAFRDQEPADWRQLNEEVDKAGGHVGIMRAAKGRP